MKKTPANLRKLLEWLDRVSPLLEAQIVAAGFSHTLDKALMRNFAEMNLREATVSITARGRDALRKIPCHAPSHQPAHQRRGDRCRLCPLTAAANLFNRRAEMLLGAPVSGLSARFEFHGLGVRPGHDEIALDHLQQIAATARWRGERERATVGSSFGPLRNVFTQPRPEAVIGRTEIPQRSSLPPYRDVLSFRSGAPTAPTSI